MLNALLGRLRPKDNSLEAIATAIGETDRALAAKRAELDRLTAGRGEALLAGGDTAEQHEADLVAARAEFERLEALRSALVAKQEGAREAGKRARVLALVSEAQAKHAAFVAWHGTEYLRAAQAIVKGCNLEAEALEAMKIARQAMRDVPGEWPTLPADTLRSVLPGARHNVGAFGDLVQLPPARWDSKQAEPVRLWPLPAWSPTGALGATSWSEDLGRRAAEAR